MNCTTDFMIPVLNQRLLNLLSVRAVLNVISLESNLLYNFKPCDIYFDCLFLGCHCLDFNVVHVPLLSGFRTTDHQVITQLMLDVFLFLPKCEGLVVFDCDYCRVHRIKYEAKEKVYYEYTMVFLDQVRNTAPHYVYCSACVYSASTAQGGVIILFANGLFVNNSFVAIEILL